MDGILGWINVFGLVSARPALLDIIGHRNPTYCDGPGCALQATVKDADLVVVAFAAHGR